MKKDSSSASGYKAYSRHRGKVISHKTVSAPFQTKQQTKTNERKKKKSQENKSGTKKERKQKENEKDTDGRRLI